MTRRVATALDAVNNWTGRAVSWLTFILVLVTVWDVLARYFFKSGSVALQELEWHLFSVIFLLAAGYTLRRDGHVRVDVVYSKLSAKWKAVIDFAGSILFLLPFCFLIIFTSIGFIESSWNAGEGSGDPGGLPARYLLKAMIPIGFSLLALQGISLALQSAMTIFSSADTSMAGPDKSDKG